MAKIPYENAKGQHVVKIIQTVQPFSAGDVTAFEPDLAAKYVAKEYAVYLDEADLEATGALEKMKRRKTAREADAARESLASEAKAIENEEVVAKAKTRKKATAAKKADGKDAASKAEAEAKAATK